MSATRLTATEKDERKKGRERGTPSDHHLQLPLANPNDLPQILRDAIMWRDGLAGSVLMKHDIHGLLPLAKRKVAQRFLQEPTLEHFSCAAHLVFGPNSITSCRNPARLSHFAPNQCSPEVTDAPLCHYDLGGRAASGNRSRSRQGAAKSGHSGIRSIMGAPGSEVGENRPLMLTRTPLLMGPDPSVGLFIVQLRSLAPAAQSGQADPPAGCVRDKEGREGGRDN